MYRVYEVLTINEKIMGLRVHNYNSDLFYDIAIDSIDIDYRNRLNYRIFSYSELQPYNNLLVTQSEIDNKLIVDDVSKEVYFIEDIFENLDEDNYIRKDNGKKPRDNSTLSKITFGGYGAMGLGYSLSETIEGLISYIVMNKKLAKLIILKETDKYPQGKEIYIGIKNIRESRSI